MLWTRPHQDPIQDQQETRSADQRRPTQNFASGRRRRNGRWRDSGSPCRRRNRNRMADALHSWRSRTHVQLRSKRMGHGRHYEKRDRTNRLNCTASCAKRISRWSSRFRRAVEALRQHAEGPGVIEHIVRMVRVTTSITYCKSNAFWKQKVAAFSKEKSCPSRILDD